MTDIEIGRRYRVTETQGDVTRVTEGTVSGVGGGWVNFEEGDLIARTPGARDDVTVTVEPLQDPEPPHRSIVSDKEGTAWERQDDDSAGWYRSGYEGCYNWAEVNDLFGPLTILREGR